MNKKNICGTCFYDASTYIGKGKGKGKGKEKTQYTHRE